MRDPAVVIDNLSKKAVEQNYEIYRIYRNLYNSKFYLEAYQKIYANEGNMTEGVDGKTIDDMNLKRIDNLIEKLRNESYQPKPVRRTYIPKKNGKKRPLGIPTFDDKLVQEVVRRILEAIYEPKFSEKSHAFRPKRSCHTALMQIREGFKGTRWFIEGDIKSFFDNIEHHTMIRILRKTIKDEKFINLIWKFLKSGYMEEWKFNRTYSGTPQGGIISPILSNIYLNEFDSYMREYKKQFDKGKRAKTNSKYSRINNRIFDIRKKTDWKQLSSAEKKECLMEIKKLQIERRKLPSQEPMDPNFRRLNYVRYADDFIIGVIGSKKDCQEIKQDITAYLKNKLFLELSQEKTLITHGSKKARFLGYDITISRSDRLFKTKGKDKTRAISNNVTLLMPKEVWVSKLLNLKAMKRLKDGRLKPWNRSDLIHHDDLEIINIYDAQIRGLYNYYCMSLNVAHNMWQYRYFMEYSMYKTFGRKYKTKITKLIKYKFNVGGSFGIKYHTKEGTKVKKLYKDGFNWKQAGYIKVCDNTTPHNYLRTTTNLIDRLQARFCEWCGKENTPIHMHHVRKLKDLKGKNAWEKHMIARKRKTIALCINCHENLHAGRLD